MRLSIEEREQIDLLCSKYPVVKKVWDELLGYEGADVTKSFYSSICFAIGKMSEDVLNLAKGDESKSLNIIGKDDKTFERIDKLIVNAAKYFDAVSAGKRSIDPELVKLMTENSDKPLMKLKDK